jgi:hypothetical protein
MNGESRGNPVFCCFLFTAERLATTRLVSKALQRFNAADGVGGELA